MTLCLPPGRHVRRILKSTINLTGKQCRKANTSLMWSLVLVLVSPPAAAFWTGCTEINEFFGQAD